MDVTNFANASFDFCHAIKSDEMEREKLNGWIKVDEPLKVFHPANKIWCNSSNLDACYSGN